MVVSIPPQAEVWLCVLREETPHFINFDDRLYRVRYRYGIVYTVNHRLNRILLNANDFEEIPNRNDEENHVYMSIFVVLTNKPFLPI